MVLDRILDFLQDPFTNAAALALVAAGLVVWYVRSDEPYALGGAVLAGLLMVVTLARR